MVSNIRTRRKDKNVREKRKLVQNIFIGAVSSIERNHEQVELAKAGEEVRGIFGSGRVTVGSGS